MNNINSIRNEYPSIISAEQLRKILHMSKRRVAWLLENEYIPCRKNSKQTHKYEIKIDDAIHYILDSAEHPERYRTPQGIFTSSEYSKRKTAFPKVLPVDDFKPWLEDEWYNVPDMLTNTKVASLTGYSDQAINRWFSTGRLRTIKIQGDIVTTKKWLISFYCSEGYVINMMSAKHLRLMKKFFSQNQ